MCLKTACVKIQAQTRGLHDMTCTSASTYSTWPAAAIYLDSYGNSIKNAHVEGFYDAIVVGDYADQQGGVVTSDQTTRTVTANTIANVVGAFGGNSGGVQNTVHICNPNWTGAFTGACSPSTSSTPSLPVSNLTILQALIVGNGSSHQASAVEDDNASGGLNPSGGVGFIGLYSVGTTSGTSYTRFTTSPGTATVTPTWGVGSTSPTSCSSTGSIFSNAQGTGHQSNTIFVCTSGGHWVAIGN
jgi:hypothetical protein